MAQKLPRMLMFEVFFIEETGYLQTVSIFFSMIVVSYWVSYGSSMGMGVPSLGSLWIPLNLIGWSIIQRRISNGAASKSQNGQGQALLAGNSGSALLEAWCQYAQRTVAHPPWWLHTRFVCMDDEHPQKATMIEISARVLATFQNQTNMGNWLT